MTRTETTITPYPDGPLIVRGDVVFRNEAGEEIRQPRRTAALCRCGVSAIKPWCDGTHKLIGFTTSPAAPDAQG
ncbi:CDGSH iron-sulfur domain-containing protein [Microbacterium sp. Sa4CUA7]|uniref:CDGSH iron-sulfur domain-containing protein n=1 Tax=Microbacterium pullorum TaxID=2762236 RepID=A0ABR8S4U2_9MICO|nr:CDGSH iron-sulfur domain-containing protein [Microbacterium pullorum]MBD7958503.1 CDGSH iron-sulfur domain-containing protein [Microbacterium pullorum]